MKEGRNPHVVIRYNLDANYLNLYQCGVKIKLEVIDSTTKENKVSHSYKLDPRSSSGDFNPHFSWNGKDMSGNTVLPGEYDVKVSLDYQNSAGQWVCALWSCESRAVRVVKYDIKVEMYAYRPLTDPFRWWAYVVPDSKEEDPGVGIRINGDDDNKNGKDDRDDNSVTGEDDLINVILKVSTTSAPAGLEYVLKRSNSNIKVWDNKTKGMAILNTNNEQVLTFSENTMVLWVEYSSVNIGTAFLELQARNTQGQKVISYDKIRFYSFTSIVIAFGGKDGYPADPIINDDGAFVIATDLYRDGYDVYMFEHSKQSNARDEVNRAIDKRGISQVGIFGYSWGGDVTYSLQEYIKNKEGFGTSFRTKFTAYIDAVNWPGNFALTERPLSADYLLHYYEKNTKLCHGDRVKDALEGDYQVELTDTGVTHRNIDDQAIVQSGIKAELKDRVVP